MPSDTTSPNPPPYTESISVTPDIPDGFSASPPNGVVATSHPGTPSGPTPLGAQPLIPYAYYDPRSPYSMAQADTRARWRFVNALLWGLGLWIAIGFLIGVEVIDYDSASSHDVGVLWAIRKGTTFLRRDTFLDS